MLVQGLVAGKQVTSSLDPVSLAGQRATSLALVFSELLGNALEHGGRHVRIELGQRLGDVVLTVSDDGAGIDGDLEGSYLRRILLRDTAHFENRFAPARLNDDELAVAEVMHRMAVFVQTGEPFYSLAEASHDHYLGMLVDEAAESGHTLHSGEVPGA
jgi:K+-sensing histidine kinase KdpD